MSRIVLAGSDVTCGMARAVAFAVGNQTRDGSNDCCISHGRGRNKSSECATDKNRSV